MSRIWIGLGLIVTGAFAMDVPSTQPPLQSGLSHQMDRIRKDLDEAHLESARIEKEIESQEVFLMQLKDEKERIRPQLETARGRLFDWLSQVPQSPAPLPVPILPLPQFSKEKREVDGIHALIREELEKSYAQYQQLLSHWTEAENQIREAQLVLSVRRRSLSDLQDNLRSKLTEKETFRKRLHRNPRLIEQLKADYALARREINAAIQSPTSNTEMELLIPEGVRLALPLDGEIIKGFGKTVHPRYQTVTESRGLHIQSPSGREVAAVLPGEVVFVGSYGLFGQLVMVRHDRNIRTLTSGFSRVFVEKGQRVNYRQVLGLSGHGFGLEYEGIYFEVREGRKSVDPLSWIKSAQAARFFPKRSTHSKR